MLKDWKNNSALPCQLCYVKNIYIKKINKYTLPPPSEVLLEIVISMRQKDMHISAWVPITDSLTKGTTTKKVTVHQTCPEGQANHLSMYLLPRMHLDNNMKLQQTTFFKSHQRDLETQVAFNSRLPLLYHSVRHITGYSALCLC